jgi:ribonuclease BN (tRNA processing enzyme)
LLVVYHIAQGNPKGLIPDEQFLSEIQEVYKGKVVIGRDLGVY